MPHHCIWQIFSVCLLCALDVCWDLGVAEGGLGVWSQAMDRGCGSWMGGGSWGQSFACTCCSFSCTIPSLTLSLHLGVPRLA